MQMLPRSMRKTIEHSRKLFDNRYAVGILIMLIVGTVVLLLPLPA